MEVDEGSDKNSDVYPHWMAAYACLKIEFTEGDKCHDLTSRLKLEDSYSNFRLCFPFR